MMLRYEGLIIQNGMIKCFTLSTLDEQALPGSLAISPTDDK